MSSRFAESRFAEYRFAESRFTESRFAESRFAESRFAESRFAESRFAESRFAEYRFAEILSFSHPRHDQTSVESVIFFLFLQPQLLQILLSPANLTIAIHFILASHNLISTNFNAFKTHWHASLQTLQNINTSHQH